jgi:hypothetical protein
VNVFISNPSSLRDLQDFLRRADCIAEQCRPNQLEVYVPSASNDDRARRHVNIFLATWQAKNEGVEAYVVEDKGSVEGATKSGAGTSTPMIT